MSAMGRTVHPGRTLRNVPSAASSGQNLPFGSAPSNNLQPFKRLPIAGIESSAGRRGYDGRGSRCCFLHRPNFIAEKNDG